MKKLDKEIPIAAASPGCHSTRPWKIFRPLLVLVMAMTPGLFAQHLELVGNRVTAVHNGNLIRTRFGNYGNLGHRTEKPSMEWPKGGGTEYGLEFVMFAGARIVDQEANQYYIFTESYSDPYNLDENPTGAYTYSWEPLPGYYNTLLPEGEQSVAMSNIPESWPQHWLYDYPGESGSRDGMWNGEFKAAPISDQESYYAMVDWNNTESAYYPFPDDSARGGLGLQVKVRCYQWSDPLAEDILIAIYDITNTSPYTLNNVVFGMYVDADVGGPLNDVMSFDPSGDINITYQWDKYNSSTGYFGFAFLESPGIDTDGLDNDEDGLIDESRASGRGEWIAADASPYMISRYGAPHGHWSGDEDGDWDPRYHDTGSDGLLPGEEYYPGPDSDGTEENGMPDDGEPNFDRTDLDESDQIGLTSFTPALVNRFKLKDDQTLYARTAPGTFSYTTGTWWTETHTVQPRQHIDLDGNSEFVYGAGYFPLKPGQTERFSVAVVFGSSEADILGNKSIMQRIYDDNYRFATPPIKPTLYAWPGDKRVVLSWDAAAEGSWDEIYGHDFEGYMLYRATDPEFNEIKTISDAHGAPFYYEPLAQFDLRDGLTGPHPVAAGAEISGTVDAEGNVSERIVVAPGNGAHLYMGDDTGLRHFYVDEEVQNGRTYYYALVAYDKGYDFDFYNKGWSDRNPRDGFKPIYPVQNSKTITQDVVGNITFIDRNTAVVVPNAPAAGTELAALDSAIIHTGPASGKIELVLINPDLLKPGHAYQLTFLDTLAWRKTSHFRVWDLTENRLLLQKAYPEPVAKTSEIDAIMQLEVEKIETGLFDGLVLLMQNQLPDGTLTASWRGFKGCKSDNPDTLITSALNVTAELPAAETESSFGELVPSPLPSTIQLYFFDEPVGFARTLLPDPMPINFIAIDTDDGDTLEVENASMLRYHTVAHGDAVILLKKYGGRHYAVARLDFRESNHPYNDTTYVLPRSGSTLQVRPSVKNFTARDRYTFSVKASAFSPTRAQASLERIAVVPDPYVASASWEKPLYFTSGRGERRVDFIHLPPRCTIRIFSLDGKLVRTLEHDASIEDGHHSWDLTSKDGLDVAAGIYLYHVAVPGIGDKKGRFALIK